MEISHYKINNTRRKFALVFAVFLTLLGHCLKAAAGPDDSNTFTPRGNKIIEIVSEGLICKTPEGKKLSIKWKDFVKITVVTNDKGPLEDDVFWVISGMNFECFKSTFEDYTESKKDNRQELIKILSEKFLDMNDKLFFEAMTSTNNQKFVVWVKN